MPDSRVGMRSKRQSVAASEWTSAFSASVAGFHSARKRATWSSKTSRSSVGRRTVRPVRPVLMALWEEIVFPISVVGPVESSAFLRLAAICASDDIDLAPLWDWEIKKRRVFGRRLLGALFQG